MNRFDLIDALDEIVYVSDPDTYELLFANQHCQRLMATTGYVGKSCYQLLQGRDSPCEFCTNAYLSTETFFTWEHTNQMMRKHFLLKDKLICWEGKSARLEIALDITTRENLSQKVRQTLKTERTLVECIRALTAAANLDDAIHAVLSALLEFYQADRAYILEIDPSFATGSNTFERCAPGVDPQINELQNLDLSRLPFWYQAMHSKQLISIEDIEELRDSFPIEYERMRQQKIHHLMAAPFDLHERSVGYLGLDNPSCNAQDSSLLQSLSYFVCNELFKRRMQAQLEYQSRHDALTGLFNRFQYLETVKSFSTRPDGPIGVIFCDINGLKQINDSLGHSCGDDTIVRIAGILQDIFSPNQLYRLSGDEFVVLLENIGQDAFAQKISVAQARFSVEPNNGVSAGYAWNSSRLNFDALIHEADDMMYRNKQHYYQIHPSRRVR